MRRKIYFVLVLSGMAMLGSCNKERSCYSEQLFQDSKDNVCATDCPGVTGCDGKTYCNECEANKKGIDAI